MLQYRQSSRTFIRSIWIGIEVRIAVRGGCAAVAIPVVSVAKDVPQHPANHPVFFHHPVRVSTQVVHLPGLRTRALVDA